ncbi:MAG TPA: hypothetical protein VEJ22_03305 [Nitrospirota bacterium]|nr:hypothetical protein [Nitrospirota bacterium]
MPKQRKRKGIKEKAASRKPAKKAVKKKVIKKQSVRKTSKKKALKKKTTKKLAKKKTVKKAKHAAKKTVSSKSAMIEPGPPPRIIPSVEEPAPLEEAIGIVTHYYGHLGVAVIQLNKGALKTGATIHIKGHATDFTQSVESMEYEHLHIDQATAGQSIGVKVKDHAREHDIVFLVK